MKMAVYATCGKQRCLQERKQLRKELERGRKTVISYIGLESILEGIFGAEFTNEVSPLKAACDEFKTDDWQGDKENCPLCTARQEIVQETIARHESYLGNLLEGKDHQITPEERLRRAQQWLTESVYQATADITEDHLDEEGQQKLPLDLSKSAALTVSGTPNKECYYREELNVPKAYTSGNKTPQQPLKVPAIKMHKTQTKGTRPHRTLGSSNYTQDDLKLALQEVRQGKLGTRRAAMLYGIPRSTIRNHLHRMRDRATPDEVSNSSTKPTPDLEDIDYNSNDNAAKLRNFLRSRARGGSGKTLKMTKLQKCLDQAIIKDLVHTCAFMKEKTKEENGEAKLKEKYQEHSKGAVGLPQDLFEHLIVRLIEVERVQSLNGREHKKKATKFLKDTSLLKQPTLTTDVDMKVPDFKAMLASMNNSAVGHGSIVKKTTTEEAACLKMPPARMIKTEDRSSSLSSNNNNNQGLLYDGSQDHAETRRNKRGRYRCYDGDSLLQAVDIVERGEMTIARASTYFGIPHSTLEYKVRERQLRRQQGHTLDQTAARQLAVDQLGIPAGFYVADVGGARPFQSFAEKLRAMSEKQALQNRFGFHGQGLEGQMPLLLAPGLAGNASPAMAVADPAYYLLSKSPSPLPVPLPSSLRDQWALWAQKPLLSSPFFGLYHPAGFMVDPASMGFHQQQQQHQPLQPSSSTKSSMGEAINRLVEAHIYDSLQGKSGSHSSTSSHSESMESLSRAEKSSSTPEGNGWKSRSTSPHGQKRPHEPSDDGASGSSSNKKPTLD